MSIIENIQTRLDDNEFAAGVFAGLSINILRTGDKSTVQRGFFTNSAGDSLPALGFLGGLYNFLNFLIVFFNLSHDDM